MYPRRIASLALSGCLVASLSLAGAGPVIGAKAPKTASVAMTFTVTDGRCSPTEIATWAGYQVNHIRFVWYREGHSGDDWAAFNTGTYPHGTSVNSGTMTSSMPIVARPGEGWYAYAILRSNGGARLAEVTSPVAYAPAECLFP